MLLKTFRLRLTLLYTVVVVLIFSVFAFVIYLEYRKGLIDAVDSNLVRAADSEMKKGLDPKELTDNEAILKKYGKEYYVIVNQNGQVIISALNRNPMKRSDREAMDEAFQGAIRYVTAEYVGTHFRILYFPVSDVDVLRVADLLQGSEKAIEGLVHLFVFIFPFILGVSLVMSWFLAGKSLAPVIKIRSLAEEIRRGRLGKRIDIGLKGKEIDDLVVIFNEMLDSIQRSIESQKRFTSDVSHEIRSPLTSLRGSIEVALRKKRPVEEYEEVLRNNLADILRLARITDNLLFLARADNNIHEMRMQWFELNRLLENIVERLRPKADSAGLSISEDYQQHLEMRGDIDLVEQAFSNLIDNAIKYTPQGGAVSVCAKEEDGAVTVTVSDTGIGIPEQDIAHIFERFYRVNKERSRKLGGTGLGLAITKWIVTSHGGTITATSAPGRGSAFTVVLPKARD
jgi:two-component system OmpR family sensor kinase